MLSEEYLRNTMVWKEVVW